MKNIYKLDYFSKHYEINFLKKNTFHSKLGIFCTFIMCSIGLSILINQGFEVIERKKPKVNRDIIINPSPLNYSITDEFMPLAINIRNINYLPLSFDDSYIKFEINHFVLNKFITKDGVGSSYVEFISLDYEYCNESYLKRFNKYNNMTEITLKNDFFSLFCIKDTNRKIGGAYNAPYFSNLVYQLKKCQNTTENSNHCKPQEEIDNLVNSLSVSLLYLNYNVQTTNSADPFVPFLDSFWFLLDSKQYKFVDIFSSILKLETDEGWILESIKTEERFVFERTKEQSTILSNSPMIFEIYVSVSTNTQFISRSYMKVQDVAAVVGGILKFCSVIGFIVTRYFNKYHLDELSINMFFKLNKDYLSSEYKLEDSIIQGKQSMSDNSFKVDPTLPKQNNFTKDHKNNYKLSPDSKIIKDFNLKDFYKTVNFINITENMKEVPNVFSIGYLDVIYITVLRCLKISKLKKKKMDIIKNELSKYTDYSEVINNLIQEKANKRKIKINL
jgi:hypothetical protein